MRKYNSIKHGALYIIIKCKVNQIMNIFAQGQFFRLFCNSWQGSTLRKPVRGGPEIHPAVPGTGSEADGVLAGAFVNVVLAG